MLPEKKWILKPAPDQKIVDHLMKELGVSQVICTLLAQREITTLDQAREFFNPDINSLHDPFLMKDMDKAVARIRKAIESEENIMVFGDYDVDGTTSVALTSLFLKRLTRRVITYIPDRHKEGYGISLAGIDHAKETDCSLIIALDCGIKSIDKIEYAKQKGIDFIICDHHLPGDTIPDAVAVLDPKRRDCPCPSKELSGCGIGYKLIQAIALNYNISQEELYQYLDLVAVSIGADIVPVTGENRILAHYGLKRVNEFPRPGLKALLDLSGNKKEYLTIGDVVFILGPRINAAGRIESGNMSVKLLVTDNYDEALSIAKEIDNYNKIRREFDATFTIEALEKIASDPESNSRRSTVLYSPNWHKGVLGIVASRLTEKHYRPTIVMTESNGFAMGSARSVGNYDVYSAIASCSDLLEQFGGHKFAAGLTMKIENVNLFAEKFERIVSETIPDTCLNPVIEVDAELDLSRITPNFWKILKRFAPFGPGNHSPVFVTEQVFDKGYGKTVGKDHLRVEIGNGTEFFPAIGFNLGYYADKLKNYQKFNACYSIEENSYQGRTNLQLNLKDLRV